MNANRYKIITPNDLPNYRSQAGDIAEASWPEFMLHDPVADEYWHELFDRFLDYQFALLDTETNRMAAMGNSLSFRWDLPLEDCPKAAGIGSSSKRSRITRTASLRIFNLPSRSILILIIKARD